MTPMNDTDDQDIKDRLAKLDRVPERDPQAAAKARDQFLAQARELAPAVSSHPSPRHTGWNTNLFERIWKPMKVSKLATLATVVIVATIGGLFLANNVGTVSAQQILERAEQAQAAQPATGIAHTIIEDFHDRSVFDSSLAPTTTITEDYFDWSTGTYRSLTKDPGGNVLQASAADGKFYYYLTADSSPMTIERTPDTRGAVQRGQPDDPSAIAKSLFENFRSNPSVELVGKQTWTDGQPVYVLADRNYQTKSGVDDKVYAGSMTMVFNAETYALVESKTTVQRDGKEVVINQVRFLVDEVLPQDGQIDWALSDLGAAYVDAPIEEQAESESLTLSEADLAAHPDTYVLGTVPEGYTQEITATSDQLANEPYAYEVNYSNEAGETFGLQAVGLMDPGFVEENFYDGSYETAAGWVLHYSSSEPSDSGHTSAMLVSPNGLSFLLISSLPREQVQELVETIRPAQP